ncbi:ion channel [Leifsonia sp. NPDC077715]|uniref:potassium channel family protein n=1 Tax=Leifsonia sp. NPDC077715 TaxID=3155539 RepID=UPI00342E3038
MPDQDEDRRRHAWERVTGYPALAASFLFLIAYSVGILWVGQPPEVTVTVAVVLITVWAFYVIDFTVRLALSAHKGRFVRHHPIALLSVFLPLARPFLLLTGLARIRAFRGNTPSHLRRRVVVFAAAFIVTFIYVISLAELHVERYAPGSNIKTFGDAVWWACVTMATVGYGDYYPVTAEGRILAVILMMGGVAIVGTASATIVNYLNERTQHLRRRPGDQADPPDGSDRDRG